MRLQTASETISFLRELETRSASFYQSLAGKYAGQEAFFAGIAKENTKNIGNVQRTYFSIITDALEAASPSTSTRTNMRSPIPRLQATTRRTLRKA